LAFDSAVLSNPGMAGDMATQYLNGLALVIPNIIVAVIIAVLGWVIGILVSMAFQKLLEALKFEKFLALHKVQDALGKVKISDVLVQVVKYYVILVFLQAALLLVALGPVSDFLNRVVDYAPKVIGGVLVVVLAAIIGDLVREKVLEVDRKEQYMRVLAQVAKYLVVFMGLVMGLETVGFRTEIITATFITILQTIGLGVALAFGLAFGFGGQDAAKSWIGSARKKVNF